MPIYEYACGACEHRFETIQRASEAPLRDCPSCGEATLKKLLSAPVFRLKGSGWYETDFKTGNKRNVSDAPDGSGSDAASDNGSSGGDGGTKGKAGEADKNGGKSGDAKAPKTKGDAAKKSVSTSDQ